MSSRWRRCLLPLCAHSFKSFDRKGIATWEGERSESLRSVDRIIKLQGGPSDLRDVPPDVLADWRDAIGRLTEMEDACRIPSVLVALPAAGRAAQLGPSLTELEHLLLLALPE